MSLVDSPQSMGPTSLYDISSFDYAAFWLFKQSHSNKIVCTSPNFLPRRLLSSQTQQGRWLSLTSGFKAFFWVPPVAFFFFLGAACDASPERCGSLSLSSSSSS